MTRTSNREKYEDFIGWKSEDGKLEVVGIVGKTKRCHALYKVTCTECSKDIELFPLGYFVSTKGNLEAGQKPCGCSVYKWNPEQFLVLSRRAGEEKFIVHGFSGIYKRSQTKLNLECIKDGHKWTTTVSSILRGTGCSKCSGVYKPTEQEALDKCRVICEEMNYEVIGFPNGYKNARSIFEYICHTHGKQTVSYRNFIYSGSKCIPCGKEKQKDDGNGMGYYPARAKEQDFLYVLDFNGKFIKIGRSFNIIQRIKWLRTASKIKIYNIHKLRIFTATHDDIYNFEQNLLHSLRSLGLQHHVHWSNECFENKALFILYGLLDNCNLEEIDFEK